MQLFHAEFHYLTKLAVFGCDWFLYSQPTLPILTTKYHLAHINPHIEPDQDIFKSLSLLSDFTEKEG